MSKKNPQTPHKQMSSNFKMT